VKLGYAPKCNGKEIRACLEERNRQSLMDYRLKRTWHDNGMPVTWLRGHAQVTTVVPHTADERRSFEVWLHREIERCRSFLDRLRYTRGPTDFMKGLK
jgi:hypothetical protein